MIFYSTVAILIGIFMLMLSIKFFFKKSEIKKKYDPKKFKDLNKYIINISIMLLVFGIVMLTSGVLSFIIDNDFIFSCIFTGTLVIYFISDQILSKKSIIKG